jgi:small subunit ribosomal protein S2
VDVQKEANAVKEANRLNIPVIAMVDTCCDPTPIDYVIPANDDATKSIELIMDVLCKAIQEGLDERKLEKEKTDAEAETQEQAAQGQKKLRPRRSVKVDTEAEAEVEAAPAEEAPKTEE